MSKHTRKLAARNPISQRKFTNRKITVGIAKLWADNESELQVLCCIGGEMIANGKSHNNFRALCIEREVNKCIDCELINNGQNIADMLMSKDYEMSKLGLQILYGIREKRLICINNK